MKKFFKAAAGHQSAAERFANQIDAKLEEGVRPWFQSWENGDTRRILCPVNQAGTPYRGINIFMLWEAANRQGFNNPNWMTLRQANRLGGHIRKGEHHTPIIWASMETQTEMEDGEEKKSLFPVRKTFQVFNVQQIEGLPEHYYDKPPERLPVSDRIANAEEFFAAAGADIRHGGNKAYYSVAGDYIRLPDRHLFKDDESYMQTLAHEYAHWTRHPSRLKRDFGRHKSGMRATRGRNWSPNWRA
jgi:antirestriction protein ArdC